MIPKTFSTPSAWSMRARTSPPLVSLMDPPRRRRRPAVRCPANYTRTVAAGGGVDPLPLDSRGFPRWRVRGASMQEALIQWLPMLLALLGAGAAGGMMAGLLGVGGGIVIVPALDTALTLAGVDPAVALHVAVATSMA